MSIYKYAVKISYGSSPRAPWGRWWSWSCEGCECDSSDRWVHVYYARVDARHHAANCEALHRANWAAACPSCKIWGKVAKACPVCLGRGWCN